MTVTGRHLGRLGALLLCLALLAAACGGSSTTAAEPLADGGADEAASPSVDPEGTETDETAEESESADGTVDEDTADDIPSDDTPSDDDVASGNAAADDQASVVDGTSTMVRLVDPGSEPRVELRYELEDGLTETMVMTMRQELSQTVDGTALPPVEVPETVIVSNLAASREGDNYRVSSEMVDAYSQNADPALLAAVDAELQSTIGLKVDYVIDKRGWLQGSPTLDGIDALGPQLAQMMEQLTGVNAPLPTEPVGVGAVWETTSDVAIGIAQTATYTVESIEGPVVKVSAVIDQMVEPGDLVDLGIGEMVEVLVWDITGSGTATWDLTSMVAESSSTNAGQQGFQFSIEGQDSVIEQTMQMSMSTAAG